MARSRPAPAILGPGHPQCMTHHGTPTFELYPMIHHGTPSMTHQVQRSFLSIVLIFLEFPKISLHCSRHTPSIVLCFGGISIKFLSIVLIGNALHKIQKCITAAISISQYNCSPVYKQLHQAH